MTPAENVRKLLREVMADHRICADDFFSGIREKHLVAARMDAARRLRACSYSVCHIGRILKRDHTTVRYYLDGDTRAKKQRRAGQRYVPPYLDNKTRLVIERVAAQQGVKPVDVVARWVSERAQSIGEVAT